LYSADLRSLGLLRIYLGVLLVADMVLRLGQAATLYSNDGVLSNHFALFRPLAPHQFSIYFTFSSARDVTAAFLATLVVYVLFLVGYRTRLFQLLSFVCVTSLHARNLMAELPSDVPLHIWMAWSLFLPLGSRFSVDSLRRSMTARRERSPEDLNVRPPAAPAFASIAVLGMLLQLAVMHFVTGLHQGGASWRDGSALYYALHQASGIAQGGAWLASHVSTEGLRTLSAAYRNVEMALGVLVLVPFLLVRRLALVGLVLFHLLSRALFDFGPYDAVMLAGAPLLLSSEDWRAIARFYQRRKRPLKVYFDADCGFCLMACRLLARFDLLSRLSFDAGSSEAAPDQVRALSGETAVVVDEKTGDVFGKSRAFAAVVSSLPMGAPLGWVLRLGPIARLLDRLYDKIAKNRASISVWFGYEACGVRPVTPKAEAGADPGLPLGRATIVTRELAAALFLAVCSFALARGTEDEPRGSAMAAILGYPRIFQTHNLLSPDPPKRTGTVVVDAQSASGKHVDLLTGQPPSLDLLQVGGDTRLRIDPLMRAFFSKINLSTNAVYLQGFRDYVAKLGDQRSADDKVLSFTIDWVEATIPTPPGASEATAAAGEPLVPRRKLASRP
jgi:predicted DCC family thiol-disulfide oxidoreductase YuxK